MRIRVPKDFTHFRVGATRVVAHEFCLPWARSVLESETLYAWASRHPERVELPGRLPAYSVPLPESSRRVVIRHARHGGLLGPLLGDFFLPPTRAPYELLASYVLANAGVRTPPVLAFAVYRAGWMLRRSDFVTLQLPGRDLGNALLSNPDSGARSSWMTLIADLVRAMTRAGAWHPDFNVRNILLVSDESGAESAFVLDVDRVQFAPPGDPNVEAANLARLERSVRKLRRMHGAGFSDDELRELRRMTAIPAIA